MPVYGSNPSSALLAFNATDPQHPSWESKADPNLPFFYENAGEYLRFGEAGILVFIGGWDAPWANNSTNLLRNMSKIEV